MRVRFGVVLMFFCAITPLAFAARILPPACGDDKVKFEVKVEKGLLEFPPIAPGKARLVFIETLDKHGVIGAAATARYGVDGAWVGANKGNSYFFIDVDPGNHQICANWQAINTTGRNVGMTEVNAAAGRTYYFETAILEQAESDGPHRVYTDIGFRFNPVPQQEGQYRLRMYALSTFTSK